MSYWVYLEDEDGSPVQVKPHSEGGTHVLGGTSDAELNVTYNYSEVYSLFSFSLRDLHEQRGLEAIPRLRELVKKLGTRSYEKDYWAPTPGNAGKALATLLTWATEHPAARFRVS